MGELRSYHCNICGAWLLIGERHTCDPIRIDIIDRIADFLSQAAHKHDKEDIQKELRALVSPERDATADSALNANNEIPPKYKDTKR